MTNPMLRQGLQLLRNGSSEALAGSPDSATFLSVMAPLTATPETSIRDCLIKPDWAP